MKDKITGKSIYISGAISSDPDYKRKFDFWENLVLLNGASRCINPTNLLKPIGHTYEEYMEVDLIFVRRCEMILMLPCYKNSPGAKAELAFAQSLKKEVVFARLENVPAQSSPAVPPQKESIPHRHE